MKSTNTSLQCWHYERYIRYFHPNRSLQSVFDTLLHVLFLLLFLSLTLVFFICSTFLQVCDCSFYVSVCLSVCLPLSILLSRSLSISPYSIFLSHNYYYSLGFSVSICLPPSLPLFSYLLFFYLLFFYLLFSYLLFFYLLFFYLLFFYLLFSYLLFSDVAIRTIQSRGD